MLNRIRPCYPHLADGWQSLQAPTSAQPKLIAHVNGAPFAKGQKSPCVETCDDASHEQALAAGVSSRFPGLIDYPIISDFITTLNRYKIVGQEHQTRRP